MWAKIEDASITELIPRPKSLTIGDIQYPHNIFGLWSVSELEAIGIYEATIDYTNLKDNDYYQNTDITYAYASGAVTGTYGSATAKSLTNVLYTAQNESDGLGTEGEIKEYGLKTRHKESINSQANVLLQKYDWYTLREASGGTATPSAITTYQAAVRTKANTHCTSIDAAANVDALAALTFDWPDEPS